MADETVSQGSDASYAAGEAHCLSPRQERQVFDALICMSEMVGEALASAESYNDASAARDYLLEINSELWKLRWEIGLLAGHSAPVPPVCEPTNELEPMAAGADGGGA